MATASAGARFRQALKDESPLQVIGTIIAYHALLAQRSGYKAIYLSGGGVAAGSLGLPDLGISNLDDVLTDVRRITDVCDLPLLVDVDTGFGASAFNVARTIERLLTSAHGSEFQNHSKQYFPTCKPCGISPTQFIKFWQDACTSSGEDTNHLETGPRLSTRTLNCTV